MWSHPSLALSPIQGALAVFALFLFFSRVLASFLFTCTIKAPVVGHRKWFEPKSLVRFRFLTRGKDIISAGYRKYKNEKFIVRRNDADILVLSNRYLDEIRLLPRTVLSNVHAQFKNLKGEYTYVSVVLNGDLHTRVLRNQLTPQLGYYVERSSAEFDQAFWDDFPQAEDWTVVDIQAIARTVVARMTGAVFLGYPACRTEEWLRTSVQYPLDTFQTAFTMRMFPTFTHPLLALLLPSRYRVRKHMRKAREIIEPLIAEHQAKDKDGANEIDTLLAWMVDHASGTEADPAEMSSRQLILTLASIHTTAMALSHALFDLCAHPDHINPLREEIDEVAKAHNGVDFLHQGLPRLEKLDSFLAESQRFHPPVLMAPQRLAMKPITLRDGTHIPQGTRVAFAAYEVLMDPAVTSDPERFDGFRAYRRREQAGQLRRNFMVQSDKDHLAFGHGTQACPGRFFAAAELKIVLSRLLTEYDMRFVEGESRPKTFFLDENCFPDPAAKLVLRRR
ncbi:putative cytochrome P450 monooxygenase [Lentithecium fluviatile CBS 122367]|uniref:Putative cytochrome P450 monooxygenase n=1 Tax=Lentithecium fluviatile CBS 122367 TaxID=1168545 RepID=A0A6G1JDB5_9PLEO|nr:putative cytochrome P450 monooxygenase [Lentithecium fluviatile CBS 122367]